MSSSSHCGRFEPTINRRRWIQRAGGGFGGVALTQLLASQGLLAAESSAIDSTSNPLDAKRSHFPAKARSVSLTSPEKCCNHCWRSRWSTGFSL
ncbi:MAG TPA: hypothetical protein VM510_16265, partial [Caulifigura sp.]|nr:hypothetical protein [Caulifigura sp.]